MRFVRARLTSGVAGDSDWVANQTGFTSGYTVRGGTPGLKLACFLVFTDTNGVAVSTAAARGSADVSIVVEEKTITTAGDGPSTEITRYVDGESLTSVDGYQVFVVDELMPNQVIGFKYSNVSGAPAGGVKIAFFVRELR